MAIAARAAAHHDNDLGVRVFLDIANGLRQRLAGGLIKFSPAHV
jgi:hypothetical protein